eukprot:gnl/Dysnectes_brevis/7395_a12341_305.p1 GENE.gnl/Dysnectes_brevis/7395_a12341_305~~gnl/Dysnectes_brevis/7395_a12341_305.p1  ORF type:complete len:392 (-),score=31.52 gnl/Dysnectes_brevis/7395_a12341_305:34-1209(-)
MQDTNPSYDDITSCLCTHLTSITPSHLRVCPYQLVQCPECTQKVPRATLHLHAAESCVNRIVTCHICDLDVSASNIYKHLEEEHEQSCKTCGDTVSDVNKHLLTQCPICHVNISACSLLRHLVASSSHLVTLAHNKASLSVLDPATAALQGLTARAEDRTTLSSRCSMLDPAHWSSKHRFYPNSGVELTNQNGYHTARAVGRPNCRTVILDAAYSSGCVEWVVKAYGPRIGVSPAPTTEARPSYPGSRPGSIALLHTGEVVNGDLAGDLHWITRGYTYVRGLHYGYGDIISVKLDMDRRRVFWKVLRRMRCPSKHALAHSRSRALNCYGGPLYTLQEIHHSAYDKWDRLINQSEYTCMLPDSSSGYHAYTLSAGMFSPGDRFTVLRVKKYR